MNNPMTIETVSHAIRNGAVDHNEGLGLIRGLIDRDYGNALKWYKKGCIDATDGEIFEDGIESEFYDSYGEEFGNNDDK